MKDIDDLEAGKAGEHLVCADLILKGYVAFPSDQGLPFDVILYMEDKLYKIQVKTTRKIYAVPQRVNYTPRYIFHIKRCGKFGNNEYKKENVDIFALVALDSRIIGYLPFDKVKKTMHFHSKEVVSVKDKTQQKERIKELKLQGFRNNEIGGKLGLDNAYISRVLLGRENDYIRRYLTDFKIEDCIC